MNENDGLRICWRCHTYETTNPSGVCWRCREQDMIDDAEPPEIILWLDPDEDVEPDDSDAPLYDTDERNS